MVDLADLEQKLTSAVGDPAFSGVVGVRLDGQVVYQAAAGLADRAEGRPMKLDTALATASGTKGFTALTVVSLIEDGLFEFDTPVSELTGGDLPNVDSAVTVEHLLGHTSGAGDYLDEDVFDDVDAYVLDTPVHLLLGPEDFLPMLLPHPQRTPPGQQFVYNNSGYIILALIIERASGRRYHDVVAERVFDKAAMTATAFHRSDRLAANCSLGYLSDGRTNIFNLPVIGTGDGGAYTTAGDMFRFWDALFDGSIVGRSMVDKMTTPNSAAPPTGQSYGLGFWLGPGPVVELEGMDAGVSLLAGVRRSEPTTPDGQGDSRLDYCVISNTAEGAWPIAKLLRASR